MFINNKNDIVHTKVYLAANHKSEDALKNEEQEDTQKQQCQN
ncbi:hypothetical protein [uncultured Helicobacter sp.]|nr:hypothetical protein [uncultured Helicobacter sp.]